jgi:deazaflavin-dependent oxidoreductase (nitroreductase family)
MRVVDGRNYILVASRGGAPTDPQWAHNLRANPDVEIRDKTEVYAMRVREVLGAGERERLWKIAVNAFPPYDEYQGKTERVIPLFLAEPRQKER